MANLEDDQADKDESGDLVEEFMRRISAQDALASDLDLQTILDKIWERYDEDGNKMKDKVEMAKFVYGVFGMTVDVAKVDKVFEEVDLDQNGVIDKH